MPRRYDKSRTPGKKTSARTRSDRYSPRDRAGRRGARKSADITPYVVAGGLLAAVVVVVAMSANKGCTSAPSALEMPRAPKASKARAAGSSGVRRTAISGGFPSKAEDMYREARRSLDEAISATEGIDQAKLKAAIKKLDAAVDEYRKLKEKHPDEPRIEKRINFINKLRYRAGKSLGF